MGLREATPEAVRAIRPAPGERARPGKVLRLMSHPRVDVVHAPARVSVGTRGTDGDVAAQVGGVPLRLFHSLRPEALAGALPVLRARARRARVRLPGSSLVIQCQGLFLLVADDVCLGDGQKSFGDQSFGAFADFFVVVVILRVVPVVRTRISRRGRPAWSSRLDLLEHLRRQLVQLRVCLEPGLRGGGSPALLLVERLRCVVRGRGDGFQGARDGGGGEPFLLEDHGGLAVDVGGVDAARRDGFRRRVIEPRPLRLGLLLPVRIVVGGGGSCVVRRGRLALAHLLPASRARTHGSP